ncbi:MAG: molybdopterin molybdenumtransferase MoeA, partial [Acetobacteraceae bacterium]|nr:molybdopterin molybdenumtransferase MoeA [Acetobacteraceae bacterium]
MISVEEARERILRALAPTPAETVPLAAAGGRVLARPVLARLTQPPADVSAMDGYAVRAADTAAGGAALRLAGGVAAGEVAETVLEPGTAARISTGAA